MDGSLFKEFVAKFLVIVVGLQSPGAVHGQDTASVSKPIAVAAPLGQPSLAVPAINSALTAGPLLAARSAPANKPGGVSSILTKPPIFKPHYVPVGPEDPADPYIAAQASALGNNPGQIFAFVRDQIGFEAYYGSVRGARGTLWAQAGNTLDKASLLVALLGAAGFSARYEHASIGGGASQRTLIYSMFPQTGVLVGCIPLGTGTTDPANNSAAQNGSSDYYWVEYGPSNIPLDPNVPGALPGQTFQTADSSFSTVPESLQQQVTISINAELYSQAGGLYGFGPSTTTVLTQTFKASALVGNIITAGNFVTASGGGALDFTASTFTYTPYILIGSGGPEASQDTTVTGTPYQELYSNLAFSSQVLTGLFLVINASTATNPTGSQKAYSHTIFDRIGPAARQGNASVQLNLPSPPAPALTDLDLTTVNILTGRENLTSYQAQQTRMTNAYNDYEAIQPELASIPTSGTLTDSQQEIVQQAATLAEYLAIAEDELITINYDGAADALASQLDTQFYAQVYPNSPRITITQLSPSSGTVALDVLKNDMLVIGGLGQSSTGAYDEEVSRGLVESAMESTVLNQSTGQSSAVGIAEVFGALGGNPNLLTVISPGSYSQPENADALSSTNLTPDAQTLILDDVANGNMVTTPTQMVTVNGMTTVGWLETDPITGHTISHFVNGGHQSATEFNVFTSFLALLAGLGIGFFIKQIGPLLGSTAAALKSGHPPSNPPGAVGLVVVAVFVLSTGTWPAFLIGFMLGYLGLKLTGHAVRSHALQAAPNVASDPPVLPFIGTPLGLTPVLTTPGTTPGVKVGAPTVDPLYTMPVNGNQLPVFDLPITNTGPSTDTFNINIPVGSWPAYFQVYSSVSSLTLLGGQTGMVNVCVVPPTSGTELPTPGAAQNYTVTVTSATNPSVTASAQPTFSAPALPSLGASLDPSTLTVAPGGTVNATLDLSSIGNVAPGPVTLTATAPTGITVNGLTSPATVPLNGLITEALSFTAAANLANNTYTVTLTASYTASGGTAQQVPFDVPLVVTGFGTCAVSAAAVASQVGKTVLATDLGALVTDINAAAGTPTNSALQSRVVSDMHLILINELTAAYFQSIVPSLTAATNAVASATSATLLTALGNLNTALCPLGTLLSQANLTNSTITIAPSDALSQMGGATGPGLPAVWTITLTNGAPTLQVYDLSVTGVPSGVTVQFSQPTITLGPGGSEYGGVTLTLTPGATFNQPFSFNVVATPVGATNFAVSTPGTLLVRPESIYIDEVTATPQFANPGTSVTVTARVFAVVNEEFQTYGQLTLTDPNGNVLYPGYQSTALTLTPSTAVQTITFPAINTTSFINGVYTLSVQTDNPGHAVSSNTAIASLLIGSPLSAVLTANPSAVTPGSSSVQVELTLNRNRVTNPVSTLLGTVQVNGIPQNMVLYPNGKQQLAYVCSDSVLNIVDVTNPASPTLLSTFGGSLLTQGGAVTGFQQVGCGIYNSDLIVSYSRPHGDTSTGLTPTYFAVFSLANPLTPTQVGSVSSISRSDGAGVYVLGNDALFLQNDSIFGFLNVIEQQNGDVDAVSLADAPATGVVSLVSDLYPCGGINSTTGNCNNSVTVNGTSVPNAQYSGGPYPIEGGTEVNSTTFYLASSSSSGGNVEEPGNPAFNGQLVVVDDSNPSSLSILTKVNVPQSAYLTSVAVQGNTALAVGDTLGQAYAYSGFQGTLVLASFNITNPQSPVLLDSVVTTLGDKAGPTVVPLGNNTFVVGGTTNQGTATLTLVDASNPSALRYIPYNELFVASPKIANPPYFYTLSGTPSSTTNELSIFQLGTITGPRLSVSLQIPTTGNAALVPSSFSLTPTSSTPGTGFTTYVWNQPSSNTITFNMNLTDVNPGTVTTLVNSGQVNYTVPTLGAGTLDLGALSVLTQHILSITPATQTISYGGTVANYTATITNPTSTSQTFSLSVLVPPTWTFTVPASIVVAPGASQNFNVAVAPPPNVPEEITVTFNVAANTASGISDSAPAQVYVYEGGSNLGSNNNSTTLLSFVASVSPSQITVPEGGSPSQPFSISVTNTGNGVGFIYINSPSNLPAGWSASSYYPAEPVEPQPNATSTVVGTLSVPAGTTPGIYPLTIPVTNGTTHQNVTLSVKVSSAGVTGYISPGSGTTNNTFVLNLTNTGNATDTFNLSVVGPLVEAASVPASVKLAAGASQQNIPITLSPVNYVIPSSTQLQVRAVSTHDPNVFGVFSATVTVPSTKSVKSAIVPSPTSVSSAPSVANLLFEATNTGNVTDSYSAQITGTTGPVTASLVNTSGQSAESVSPFYVTALGTAQIPLNANVTGSGKGTVTVAVTSLTSPSVTSKSTVTINGPAAQTFPSANAGTGGNIPLHRIAILNGSASVDTNTPPLPLSYAWTVVSVPTGSAVTTASIRFPTSPEAVFVPDVLGSYTFKLTVTTTAGNASANVNYTAQIFPPVAVPGKPQNAETGTFVFLNGKDSYDPNSLPITFAWKLAALPSGSALTAASLLNATTPKPFFTPDVNGVYKLQLIVNNGTLSSTPETVQITAATGSLPPNANAGYNQNALVGQTVTLNGSGSFDPNSPPLPDTYVWTFESVPAGSALTNAQILNAATVGAQFVPDVAGAFVFNLRVANTTGASDDTVTVDAFTGYAQGYLNDVPPNASSGAAQYAIPGSTQVSLNGSASADPDNGPLSLSYNWWVNALPPSSAAALVNPATATPHFTPDVTGYYIPRLEASDGFASGFVNTLVTAAQKCDADANGVINQIDIDLITAAIGQIAPPNDPSDPLAAGTVTQADLTYCKGLITTSLPNAGSNPPSLTFTGAVGITPASQPLSVTSSGASFSFTVGTDSAWLIATPGSGNTASNTINVSVITTGLAAQTLNGNVIITASGAGNSPFKIPVKLNLESTSIAATAGTPQVADVGAPFTTALQAIVKDVNGPVQGANVTFTATSTGASGTFPGNLTAIAAVTNVSGIATAPAFTANATAGNYMVTATVDGAASPADFALTNAVPGSTSLGGAIEGKSGPSNARVWIFEVGNDGPGSALGAEITGITLVQTNGAACTPVITSPASFPLLVGNIAPQATADVDVTINFTGCASTAAFTVTAIEQANDGAATGTIVRLNQFQ